LTPLESGQPPPPGLSQTQLNWKADLPMTTLAIPTTPHGLAAMDPLELALAGFLSRYKGKTFESYQMDLRHFLGWCMSNGLAPLQATRPHLELYLRHLEADGWTTRAGERRVYSTATINRRFNTIALFYRYALRDELIVKDPAAFVDRPRIDHDAQRRTYLPPLQHGIFLAQAEKHGVMAHALACLLGMRGLRIGATVGMDVGSVTVQDGYHCVTFIAKGGLRVTQALPLAAVPAVLAAVGQRTDGPLLLNCWGNRMSRHNADRLIKQICRAACIDTDISPHSLRRSFITTGLASGVPAQEMQQAAGHRQINTTMIYDRRRKSHDRDAVHAVNGFLAGVRG
jgi:integrase/recombinase XerD